MKNINLVLILILLFAFNALSNNKKSGNDFTKVKLELSNKVVEPGSQILLIYTFIIDKDWHIYWRNPGDSGLPTKIEIEDNNFTVEDYYWLPPIKFQWDEFTNYGYKDSTKIIVPISIPKNTQYGKYQLKSSVSWLVCKDECLPGKQNFTTTIEVGNNSVINSEINEIILNYYPFTLNNILTSAKINNDTLFFKIGYNSVNYGKVYTEFFPLEEGYYQYSGIKSELTTDNAIDIILPLDNLREKDPDEISGLLVIRNYDNHSPIFSFYVKSKIN